MAISLQNLRATGTGIAPTSLLPGQICFNLADKVLYVGDGSDFQTNFDGTQVNGVPGAGWYSMPMDFDSLSEYFVPNPQYYGDMPLDQQVLTWSDTLNHPIWTSGGGGGGNQVYIVTNGQVATAPGITTSDKITNAVGASSPDEGDVTIVTGLPGEVYQGLYFFGTAWARAASYAYPTATQVLYDNTGRTLGPTVQEAISDLDDGLTATTAIANTAKATADSALAIADAALPLAGGTMTGTIVAQAINVQSGHSVLFNNGTNGAINGVTDATNVISSTVVASASAVKTAYDIGADAVPRSSYTTKGDILIGSGAGTFSPLPPGPPNYILASVGGGNIQWVQNAAGDVTSVTGTAPITVDNTDPQAPVVGIDAATTSAPGAVQLNDTVNSTSTTQAATANAVKTAYDAATAAQATADAALPKAGGTMTGNITFQDAGEGVVFNGGSQIFAISDSTSTTSSTTAASSTAAKAAYDAGVQGQIDAAAAQATADAALPKAGGTMTGDITFNPGQVFPGTVTSVTAVGGSAISVDNTDPTQPILDVASATTTSPGVVQLNDTNSSISTTEALTAHQGYLLQQQINALAITNNLTLAGTYDASTGLVDSVTPEGTGVGFVVGSPLPTPAVANSGYFVIIDVQGSTGPSGTPPYHIGDWFLSNGTTYDFLNVGFQAAYATTTSEGVVQLATDAEVQAGTNTDHVVVPSSLQSKMSDSTSLTSSTTIASSTAVKAAYDAALAATDWTDTAGVLTPAVPGNVVSIPVAAGVDGLKIEDSAFGYSTVIRPDLVQANDNVQSISISPTTSIVTHIVDSLLTNTAGVIAQDETATPTPYDVFASYLRVNGASGITIRTLPWPQIESADSMNINIANSLGALGLQAGGNDIVLVGGDNGGGQAYMQTQANVLLEALGPVNVKPATNAADAVQFQTSAGSKVLTVDTLTPQVVIGDGATSFALPIADGTPGQFLGTDGAGAASWCTLSLACIPCSAFTACGQLLVGTGASTFTALNPGTNGQILVPNSACANGVEWVTCSSLAICGYTCTATPFNTAIGAQAGDSVTSATGLTAIGYQAGTAVTTGGSNTFVGWVAGSSVTTGSQNVAVGVSSGGLITTGIQNTHVGWEAGDQTNASYTVAIGSRALGGNHTQNGTVAVGVNALSTATSGANNTAVGFNAGCAITAGSNNTILGTCALDATTLSTDNTAIGYNALTAVTTGGNNTAVGSLAADLLTTGSNNIAIGLNALGSTTSGASNIAIGVSAMENGAAGNSNVAVGSNAGRAVTSSCNVFIGSSAGIAVTSGTLNTFLGFTAGDAVTTGSNNTIIGDVNGSAALTDTLILAAGTTVKFQANGSGAWSPNGTSYGTAGQVLTSAGSGAAVTWASLPTASTTSSGIVQLNDTTSCTSTSLAATANAVKTAYDLANAAVPKNAFTVAGDLLVGTGAGTYSALPSGASGYVLSSNGAGVLSWVAQTGGGVVSVTGTAPITVDNTDPNNPIVGVSAATTLVPGVVQLNDTTSSTSVTEALTANQGKNLQDQINSLTVATNLTFAGTFNASTSQMASVSADGTAAGFTVGSNLPSPAVGNTDYFVIVTTGASYSPPGGGGPFSTSQGDWLLSNGTVWQYLNVGLDVPAASPTVSGLVLGRSTASSTALGCNALLASPSGSGNIGVGINAGCALSTGINNTTLGACAGSSATSSCYSVLLGASAGCSIIAANGNTLVGTSAGCLVTGANNTAIGLNAGSNITTGATNVAIGYYAQVASATGSCQLAIGFSATDNWLTGTSTKAIKPGAGIIDCAGSCGTAGQFLRSNGSNAVCWSSATATPTVAGILLGSTGASNTSIGCNALCAVSSGTNHIAIGVNAGIATTTATGNIFIGNSAGCLTTQGSNTVVGNAAAPVMTGGYSNVFIGESSGSNVTTGNNLVVIGRNAGATTATTTQEITLYNGASGGARLIGANAFWSFVSDVRDKTNIEDLPLGLDFVKELQPRKFVWNKRQESPENGTATVGFIAQEVQETVEKFDAADYVNMVHTENPDQWQLGQEQMIPFLVQAVKELAAKNEALEARLAALEN